MAGFVGDAALVVNNAVNATQMVANVYSEFGKLKSKNTILKELLEAAKYEIKLVARSGGLRKVATDKKYEQFHEEKTKKRRNQCRTGTASDHIR